MTVERDAMIRRVGSHAGRRILFGFDRHALEDRDAYVRALSAHGVVETVVGDTVPHYVMATESVCTRVTDAPDRVGVLVCGTGMGVCIAANKFAAIYAARCTTVEDARQCRTVNNANVLCLASRTGSRRNIEIIEAFMHTPFSGRNVEQLAQLTRLERPWDPRRPDSSERGGRDG